MALPAAALPLAQPSAASSLALRLLLLQLLLPPKHPRLVPGLFRLRDHPLPLIRPRNRSPRQNVLGLERQNPLRRLDRPVKILAGGVCWRQTMQRVRKFRLELERPRVLRNRLVEFPLAEEINPGVVVVFRALRFRHRRSALKNLCGSWLQPPHKRHKIRTVFAYFASRSSSDREAAEAPRPAILPSPPCASRPLPRAKPLALAVILSGGPAFFSFVPYLGTSRSAVEESLFLLSLFSFSIFTFPFSPFDFPFSALPC